MMLVDATFIEEEENMILLQRKSLVTHAPIHQNPTESLLLSARTRKVGSERTQHVIQRHVAVNVNKDTIPTDSKLHARKVSGM